eukprot:2499131-Ditylum_brightwellii.AAC.1
MEEARGAVEEDNEDGTGTMGAVVVHNSSNRNQFTPRQESHMSILWKKDHGTDVNKDKCPNYDPTLKTSKTQVAAAAASEVTRTVSADRILTSDAQGDTSSRTVAVDLFQNKGTPTPPSIC